MFIKEFNSHEKSTDSEFEKKYHLSQHESPKFLKMRWNNVEIGSQKNNFELIVCYHSIVDKNLFKYDDGLELKSDFI